MDNNNTPETISYYAHEAEVMRQEAGKKKLWIVLIIAIVLIFASNMAWLWVFNQYDYESTVTVDSKDGGNANYLGGNGDIVNGEDSREASTEAQER